MTETTILAKLERHAQLVFEHKPKELRIAVNGNFQGTLKINSDINEIDLAIPDKEPIKFIELYSEQQLRLFILNLETTSQHPARNIAHTLKLSDGRTLQTNLEFTAEGAEFNICYSDPTYKQVQRLLESPRTLLTLDEEAILKPLTNGNADRTSSIGDIFSSAVSIFSTLFISNWRRAAVLGLALMFVLGGFVVIDRKSTLSAREILEEAEIKKLNWEYQPEKILYREEEELSKSLGAVSPTVSTVKRWSNNLNGKHEMLILKYNQSNQLIWAKWTKDDGKLVIYNQSKDEPNSFPITIYPGIEEIKENLGEMGEADRYALEKHLTAATRGADSKEQAKLNTKWMLTNYTSQSVRTHSIEDNKKAICIVIRSAEEDEPSDVAASETERDFERDTLQQVLYRFTTYYKSGKTSFHETRLKKAGEATKEEFEKNDLAAILKDSNKIKRLTVEEFATQLRRLYTLGQM